MIKRIMIVNIVIGILISVVSYLIWKNVRISLSAAVGFVVGGSNFLAIAWIVRGLLGDHQRKGRFVLFAMAKFSILVFVLFAVIKWLPIDPVGMIAGLSVIVVSIVVCNMYKKVSS